MPQSDARSGAGAANAALRLQGAPRRAGRARAGRFPSTVIRPVLLGLLLLLPGLLAASELDCGNGAANVEEYHYTWRLRGGLGWLAGLVFPRSGVADLKTTYAGAGQPVQSELFITSPESKNNFYHYESLMEPDAQRTLVTFHGYAWGEKSRKERATFDYAKHLSRRHKETPGKTEDTVRMIPARDMRDVLTAIHYLRGNADTIRAPITTSIFSDGKEYPVIFRPATRQVFTLQGQTVNAVGFEIVDAPGGRRWPGGVRIWLSEDSRRIPFRIEIVETLASLQLDLQTVRSCGFMNAAK